MNMQDVMNIHNVILGLSTILGLWLYFLPTIIALIRVGKRRAAIFTVNLLFGWTVVGWVATFIWVAEQRALAGEVARLWPPDTDTWSFDRAKVSEPSLEQSDRWVLV